MCNGVTITSYKHPEQYRKSLIMVNIHNVSVQYLSKGSVFMSVC